MSVCVAFNLSDGVVIAVDSAMTVTDATGTITKVFTDSDKLFQLGNLRVGIATYGVAALHGRTNGSFVREFVLDAGNADIASLSVAEIVERLRAFFFEKYRSFLEQIHSLPFEEIPSEYKGILGLVIGGFSSASYQSELWEIVIPQHDAQNSARQIYSPGNYGYAWFASAVPIHRYLKGYDLPMLNRLDAIFTKILGRPFTTEELDEFRDAIALSEFTIRNDGMPVKSGIDCAKFLVDLVLGHYRFVETHPIVGGRTKVGVVAYDHDAFRILE